MAAAGWPRRYSRHGHSRPGLFLRTLRQRSRQENTFNYRAKPDSYYEALIRWFVQHHGMAIERSWVRDLPSTIGSIRLTIGAFCHPGAIFSCKRPSFPL